MNALNATKVSVQPGDTVFVSVDTKDLPRAKAVEFMNQQLETLKALPVFEGVNIVVVDGTTQITVVSTDAK